MALPVHFTKENINRIIQTVAQERSQLLPMQMFISESEDFRPGQTIFVGMNINPLRQVVIPVRLSKSNKWRVDSLRSWSVRNRKRGRVEDGPPFDENALPTGWDETPVGRQRIKEIDQVMLNAIIALEIDDAQRAGSRFARS